MSYHSAVPSRQPVASHMFPRLRHFFRQHRQMGCAVPDSLYRYPTRQLVLVPANHLAVATSGY